MPDFFPVKTGAAARWDAMLDAIGQSAVAAAAMRMLDPAAAAFERANGLGPDARFALFGETGVSRESLVLSWIEKLKEAAAREKAEAGSEDADEQQTGERAEAAVRSGIDGFRGPSWLFGRTAEMLNPVPKVLPGDRMAPRERIERHIVFGKPDRVGVAPCLGFHTSRAGGTTLREYMSDGTVAARAARTAWDVYGGFDMITSAFPANYMLPLLPETHSQFCSRWEMPVDDELPRMEESPMNADYDDLLRDGFSIVLRTDRGRLFGEMRRMARQMALFGAEFLRLFPRPDLYFPYSAGIINHPADLMSMWLGFDRMMMDCVSDPLKVREACERLGPGLAELGLFSCRLLGVKQVLYGVSRISASWISRKMFDSIFADTFAAQAKQAADAGFRLTFHLDNDYTAFLDFFRDRLPRHCGIMHLDQTDMFKAKQALHGHLCLMGNLHPGVLAAGTPRDVSEHCERLIKEVGAGGGFILANACEVPVNTPVENLKILKQSVEKWGWY